MSNDGEGCCSVSPPPRSQGEGPLGSTGWRIKILTATLPSAPWSVSQWWLQGSGWDGSGCSWLRPGFDRVLRQSRAGPSHTHHRTGGYPGMACHPSLKSGREMACVHEGRTGRLKKRQGEPEWRGGFFQPLLVLFL